MLLLWLGQCYELELVQDKETTQGTIWLTTLPYQQPQVQLWHDRGWSRGKRESSDVTAVTRLQFMKPQPPESSILHSGGQMHTGYVPQ